MFGATSLSNSLTYMKGKKLTKKGEEPGTFYHRHVTSERTVLHGGG